MQNVTPIRTGEGFAFLNAGCGGADFDEIARLDIKYIENWSLWLDIKLMLKTFQVILIGQGSY